MDSCTTTDSIENAASVDPSPVGDTEDQYTVTCLPGFVVSSGSGSMICQGGVWLNQPTCTKPCKFSGVPCWVWLHAMSIIFGYLPVTLVKYYFITSRVRGRGNNIGPICLCVLFVCLCLFFGMELTLTPVRMVKVIGQMKRSNMEKVFFCLVLEMDIGQVKATRSKFKCQGHGSRSPRSRSLSEKEVKHQTHQAQGHESR